MAGSPKQDMPPWGSFESWSNLVRAAIVWIGLPDPAITRAELEAEADVGKDASSSLVEGWKELQTLVNADQGLTVKDAHALLIRGAPSPLLRTALEEIGGGRIPPVLTISRHLREVKDRNWGGLVLKCIPNPKTSHKWVVVEM